MFPRRFQQLVSDAHQGGAALEDAAHATVLQAVHDGSLTPDLSTARIFVAELIGANHPDRARLQVATACVDSPDAAIRVITDVLTTACAATGAPVLAAFAA